jgi:hypothetical protein
VGVEASTGAAAGEAEVRAPCCVALACLAGEVVPGGSSAVAASAVDACIASRWGIGSVASWDARADPSWRWAISNGGLTLSRVETG